MNWTPLKTICSAFLLSTQIHSPINICQYIRRVGNVMDTSKSYMLCVIIIPADARQLQGITHYIGKLSHFIFLVVMGRHEKSVPHLFFYLPDPFSQLFKRCLYVIIRNSFWECFYWIEHSIYHL